MYTFIATNYGSIILFLFIVPMRFNTSELHLDLIAWALALFWLSFAIGRILLRNIADGPLIKVSIFTSPIAICIGFILIQNHGLTALLAATICMGTALALSNGPSTIMVLKFAPEENQATAASLDIMFARIGSVATVTFLASFNPAATITVSAA